MSDTSVVLVANAGDETISTFRLDADRLTPLATRKLDAKCSAFAVDADRDLVYAATNGDPAQLVTLGLDRETGDLTPRHAADVPDGLAYVDLAPGGAVLLGSSYGGGFGATWTVAEGVLTPTGSRVDHANVHCGIASPDGRHAYFVSLGDDLIAQCALGSDGALSPLDPPTVAGPKGSGPRHLVFADDETAYLVTEFSGQVIRYTRDADGRLVAHEAVGIFDPDQGLKHSEYGADPREKHLIWGADVHVAGGGRWLLASERTEHTIATVALDADGRLGDVAALTHVPEQPRGFNTTAGGDRVLVVGELATELALFAVGESGSLEPLQSVKTGNGANWIRVV